MSGRQRRRQSGTGPASPAQQEEVGEGELARVLAAVEALTSQVGDISTAGLVENHINGFETRQCSNFRPFWLESSRFNVQMSAQNGATTQFESDR